MLVFFLKGFLIGISIAAPVGPIGLLCIRRTMAYGRISGFVSGLGAATADGLYGLVAGFGLTAVTNLLLSGQAVLKLVGGLFLIYLGGRIFFSPVTQQGAEAKRAGLVSDYFSTLMLTVANPVTILSFTAVFAGLGITAGTDYSTASALVGGVIAGSSAWWFILSGVAGYFAERFDHSRMSIVNRLSGMIVTCFGIVALVS
jgi:threonine/homoserine/homoserine lactone efflux protein